MAQDIALFYQQCDPAESLPPGDPRYVPCENVRGEDNDFVKRLAKTNIGWSSKPVCRLLAGHRGGGKSTELLRLKQELERGSSIVGKHFVVYFEADVEDVDVNDVDFPDLLLAIIRQIARALRERHNVKLERGPLLNFLDNIKNLLGSEVEFQKLEFDAKIAKFTAAIKNSPGVRDKIREVLEPNASNLIQAANELIDDAQERLRNLGYKSLVLIVDSLDRVVLRNLDSNRTTYDRLFLERGPQMKALNCHVVYTLPIAMVFSPQAPELSGVYGHKPDVLPMVKVINQDGSENTAGLKTMREVVLARLKVANIAEEVAFDSRDTVYELCRQSGGHMRNLLILIRSACEFAETFPLTDMDVEKAVRDMGNGFERALTKPEYFDVLRSIDEKKDLPGSEHDKMLLQSLSVLEYQNGQVWYSVNPAVRGLRKFLSAPQA